MGLELLAALLGSCYLCCLWRVLPTLIQCCILVALMKKLCAITLEANKKSSSPDRDIDTGDVPDLVASLGSDSRIQSSGLNRFANCLRKAQEGLLDAQKQMLAATVDWQHKLYNSSDSEDVIKSVTTISNTLEVESKRQADEHAAYMSVTEAKEYTKKILSNPTGDLNDKNTLFQLISQTDPDALFYDPNVKSAARGTNDPNSNDIILKLSAVPGFEDIQNEESIPAQKQLISEMKYVLQSEQKEEHPILMETRKSLADVYNVSEEDIIIKDVYYGSFCFQYTIRDSEKHKGILTDPTTDAALRQKFDSFQSNKVHPCMFDAFNVNDFDQRGNKSFTSANCTHQVGPPGQKQTYTQPYGYTRYGLNVLNGKFGADHTWLDPFGHDGNWYRAFHGVKVAQDGDMSIPKIIHENGFLPGRGQGFGTGAYVDTKGRTVGQGVYCSPDLGVAEGYAGTLSLTLKSGQTKQFRMLFQVCVEPHQVQIVATNPKYWICPNSIGMVGVNNHSEDNIRAYGILLKEI